MRWPHVSTIHSASAFDWPITVFGFAALSVETSTNRFAPYSTATSATTRVPSVLFRTASSGVRLHQRDVLVRRRVEDDAGAVLVEDLPELDGVLHVADDGRCGEAPVADELALDLEQRRLGVVEQHELRRADARDLAAELRPIEPPAP